MAWSVDDPVLDVWRRLRLTAVRHGQSIWNVQRRAQGWHGPGLTPLGHRQAAATAARLAGRTDDVVLSSDLPRVVETARPHPVAATTDVRLRELDSGEWAGLPLDDVERKYAGDIARIRAGADLPRGGGETFGDLRARIRSLLTDLAAATPAGTERSVLCFTHGGPVRALAAEVLGLPDHRVLADPGNCSLTEVLLWIDGDGTIAAGRLVRYATDDHLAGVS